MRFWLMICLALPLVTLTLISAFALVTGITELVVAIGGKRLVESDLKRAFTPPKPQPSH